MSQTELYSLFAKHDRKGDGRLDFSEFLGFMTEALQVKPTTEYMEKVKGVFDSVQTNGTVGPPEACDCVDKWKSGKIPSQSSCCLLL